MADCTFTIPFRFSEASPSLRPTPVTRQFGALMQRIPAYIEAERDLDHSGIWDPACDAWIADAECARNHVLATIATLNTTPVQGHHDMAMRRWGRLTRLLIESDSTGDFRAVFALPDRFPHHFRCRGTDCAAARTNLLIAAFQQHLYDLATLPDFREPIAADDTEINMVDPDYMMAPAA